MAGSGRYTIDVTTFNRQTLEQRDNTLIIQASQTKADTAWISLIGDSVLDIELDADTIDELIQSLNKAKWEMVA